MHLVAMSNAILIFGIAILSKVRALEAEFLYSYIVKGEPYRITWHPVDDTVSHVGCSSPLLILTVIKLQMTTIELLRGIPSNMITVSTLGSEYIHRN